MQLSMFPSYSKSLEELREGVVNCQGCPYHLINDGRVNGTGTTAASVMIVGQGPGPSEVTAGRPFTGASGQMLRRYIKDAGIPMASVYMTNLIRCVQPELKSLMPKSIRMCSRWLDDEVGLVAPSIIITLGALATTEIVGVEGLEEHSGKILESRYGGAAMPMFHTAYLLRIRRKEADRYEELSVRMRKEWITIQEYI